ncbi:PREDICTED: PDZ and LIM domain protein 3 isoform X3 [Crocodylus porosus]|uniref:PDZ and LIM domain protein 3 isoform X3 n=1 Tax=Alligator mississippiensis TaxID=8496 RepID=UPI000711AE16|nr:PDZ and LIM domain protein 3 isoform X3 [Alligator mississippiensis]XP_019381467.1 PREDICTED: PDZ and LIM domain protein 3 isoform X3 [Gavialis gangeticus]XP_019408235.1 PREDICTED: PDZ and LIM domain protein 3 isoform X3 [Crocodylus porosus]
MPQNVILPGPAPWGFRLSGGIDFNQPLIITRITPGSKASTANLCPGDVILAIDGYNTENMTHNDAQERIKAASHQLCLKIQRAETKLWSPQVSEDGKQHPFKINLEAEPQDMGYFEHKHNIRPKPFVVSGLSSEPVPTSVPQSDVYRMLHDNQEGHSQPRQSGSFKVLQDLVSEDSEGRPTGIRSVKAPVTKIPTGTGSVQKVPLCDRCGNGIVGTVVKARDKYRHPECFVCSDCNINLKQKGYFFVEGQLYCETHARARMRPPEGYEAVTVYPKC